MEQIHNFLQLVPSNYHHHYISVIGITFGLSLYFPKIYSRKFVPVYASLIILSLILCVLYQPKPQYAEYHTMGYYLGILFMFVGAFGFGITSNIRFPYDRTILQEKIDKLQGTTNEKN
jgi:uncharacterized membrane protein